MANNVEITFKIGGIDYSIEQLQELGKQATKTGDEMVKANQKATEEQGYFSKKLDEVKGKLKEFKGAFGEVGKAFTSLSGGLGKLGNSFGLSGKAATVFGRVTASAVAATGIGALVIAVVGLIGYFKNLEGPAMAIKKVFAGLGAVVAQMGKAMSAILDGDWSGFKDAITGTSKAIKGAVQATEALFKAQSDLNKVQIENSTANAKSRQTIEAQKKVLEDGTKSVEERLGALQKVTAETKLLAERQQKEIETALMVAQAQLTLTNNYEERREKMKEIADLQAELIDKQTEIANIEYDAEKVGREVRAQDAADRKAKNEERIKNAEDVENSLAQLRVDALADEGEKLRQSLALQKDAAIKELKSKNASAERLAEAEKLYDAVAIKQVSDFNAAKQKEQADQTQAELDKLEQANEARRALQGEYDVLELETEQAKSLLLLEQELERRRNDLSEHGIYLENKAALDKWYTDQVTKINQDAADKQKATEEEKLAATAAAAGELADILGRETAFGKLAAVTQATINTYLGASQVVADEKLPSFLKPIMVAAIIASGLKQVAAIGQVQEPTPPKFAAGGYINGRSHSMGGVNIEAEGGEFIINKAAMSIPSIAAMAQRMNQVSSATPAVSNETEPIRAYVVATEVTSAQEANSKIQKIARL